MSIAKRQREVADPRIPRLIMGGVVSAAADEKKVIVTLNGDPGSTVEIFKTNNFTPVAGETCVILVQGSRMVALGLISDYDIAGVDDGLSGLTLGGLADTDFTYPYPNNSVVTWNSSLGAFILSTSSGSGSAEGFLVTDYGAVLDGVTDDTAAVNAAVSAAELLGGTVVFPLGVCLISSPINLATGVTYRGYGSGSIIRAAAGFSGNALMDYGSGGRSDVAVVGLTIDGNKAATSGAINGINLPASNRVVLRGVTVKNCRTRGVHLYQTNDVLVESVVLLDNGVGNDLDVGTYAAMALHGARIQVTNLRARGSSGLGLVLSGYSDQVTIDNVVVENSGYIGVGFGGSNSTNITMSNVVVKGSAAGPGVDTGNARHTEVSGCLIEDSWAGFVSDSGRWQSFTGCRVNEPGTLHGFDITATPDSNLSGCSVFIGDGGVGRGFQIVSSPRSVATGCTVNEPHPDWEAFQVYSSDDVILSACSVTDGRVSPAATNAFQVAGTSSNVLVTGVQVFGLAAADLYQDVSSGSGNIAHLIGSGTPESVIAADVGSTFTNRTTGAVYNKATGGGATGWVVGSGGGSGITVSNTAPSSPDVNDLWVEVP